jgi:Outer membrane protein
MLAIKKSVLLSVFCGIAITSVFCQKSISVDDAVSIALKNNFDIMVARNDADISKLNNTAGNAGMLPSVNLNGADNYSINDIHSKQSSGLIISSPNANSNVLTANAALNWTLFDGGKMFVTKNKLSQIEALGEINFKDKVLQTIYNVIVAYFNVVKQKQQLASINQVIAYNDDRVNILQTSFNAGASPKNNLLQAKIDLNVSHENAIAQESIIVAAKRNLNQLLCRNIDSTAYDVTDTIPLTFKPDKTELLKKVQDNNTSILSFRKQMDIAKLSLDETKAGRLPKISFNGGYYFSYSNSTVGTLYNRTYGPQLGGSITVPLYQGGNLNRLVATSKVQLKSAEYTLESVQLQILTIFQNAITDFENQQKLLAIEQENALLVKENLEISLQRLRLGQTTALEVKQAQQSYEDSFTRFINFKYNLKVAETRLKQLMAGL